MLLSFDWWLLVAVALFCLFHLVGFGWLVFVGCGLLIDVGVGCFFLSLGLICF